jgi:hypothetical protein
MVCSHCTGRPVSRQARRLGEQDCVLFPNQRNADRRGQWADARARGRCVVWPPKSDRREIAAARRGRLIPLSMASDMHAAKRAQRSSPGHAPRRRGAARSFASSDSVR